MKAALARLLEGQPLPEAEAERVFGLLLDGAAEPAQVGALLALLAARAPEVDELVGAARALRARMLPVAVPAGLRAVDACGTGGDHAGTFNISTAAALVAAAVGRPRGLAVAKHGNRAVTSRSGSSQVLEALGVPLSADPARLSDCLEEAGIAFLFAPHHHPAMKAVAPVRAALGFRTLFNLLGPLCNPAGVRRQVLGVYDPAVGPRMAAALQRLGADSAWVVSGELAPGRRVDEFSPLGPTRMWRVEAAGVRAEMFDPHPLLDSYKLAGGAPAGLLAEDSAASAALIRALFAGAGRSNRRPELAAARAAVALNAAALLQIGGVADGWPAALDLACAALDSGAAAQTLEKLAAIAGRM